MNGVINGLLVLLMFYVWLKICIKIAIWPKNWRNRHEKS